MTSKRKTTKLIERMKTKSKARRMKKLMRMKSTKMSSYWPRKTTTKSSALPSTRTSSWSCC